MGAAYDHVPGVAPGAHVATLTSLTLVPLALDEVSQVDVSSCTAHVRGTAILPASGPVAVVPDDLPLDVVLAALDVAGAPAHVRALARPGGRVAVIGAAGGAGLLCLAAARGAIGERGRLVAVEANAAGAEDVRALRLADAVAVSDARDAIRTATMVCETLGDGADLVVSVVNVPGCEGACYLSAAPGGTVLLFSMATSFTAAALGAEGVASTARLLIGNGFSEDRGAVALSLLRDDDRLRERFAARHARGLAA